MESIAPDSAGRALVVDDDPAVRHTTGRLLARSGFLVQEAGDGAEALDRLAGHAFDVVVTDISMPGMDGIRLLREIRSRDPHVQVILMTGAPALETAVSAIDFGALRYLCKPFDAAQLVHAVRRGVTLARMARLENRAAELVGNSRPPASDMAGLDVSFDRALERLWVAYHPILDARTGTVVGFEALARSREPAFEQARAILEAAERLGRLHDFGRRMRAMAVEPLAMRGDGPLLFVNLHPTDLLDPRLGDEDGPLVGMAERIVLEITERASLQQIPDAAARVAELRELGFRIAVDDLGAGYSGLSSFAHLEPEFVKLDLSLIRDIEKNHTQRRVVAAITALAQELHMSVVAEGVETEAEGEVLRELGCDLLQGFLYALPGPAFTSVRWPHRSAGA